MSKNLSILLLLIVVAIGALLAFQQLRPEAGSPGEANSTASAAGSLDPSEALAAYAHCMRDNGVPNFPEPNGGEMLLDRNEFDIESPAFKAAQAACESLRPQAPVGSAPTGDSEWEKVEPGGDTVCADGSEYAFFERPADPAKVVFYLDGGGVCFDAASCANANTPTSGERAGPDYDPNVEGENPGSEGGMFDLERADNPFRDYSFIYVPLCTADSHLGDVTQVYSPELTVEHKGFVNGTAALDYLAENYPDSVQVVVVGKTAGGVAAPIYGGLIADLLPDAQVTVFGAQSGAIPDDPDLNTEILGELWGAFDNMPDWEVNEGLTARDWGTGRFWSQAGLHNPDMVLARFDYAFDPHAAEGVKYLLGIEVAPADLVALMDSNEADIEAAGVVMNSYTAPGEGHGILEFEMFYEMEVNGVRLVDWLEALIAREPVGDVHCEPCIAE
jgi:hypothetical protein